MIPSSLIPDLCTLRPDKSSEENLLNARLLCRFLADSARELQLNDGKFICDVVDFAEVLRQIANAARRASVPAPLANYEAADDCFHGPASTILVSADSGRPPQPIAEQFKKTLSPSSDSLPSQDGAVRAEGESGLPRADGKGVKDGHN